MDSMIAALNTLPSQPPSLIPTKSGDHVKTDKKDAVKLARLHRAGELVSVFVPDETDEAVRDLCRARVDAIDDRRRAKTRLIAMLRRLGFNDTGKTTWNDAHKRYLRVLSLPFPAHRVILEELIGRINQLDERIARCESRMESLYADWRCKPIVDAVDDILPITSYLPSRPGPQSPNVRQRADPGMPGSGCRCSDELISGPFSPRHPMPGIPPSLEKTERSSVAI